VLKQKKLGQRKKSERGILNDTGSCRSRSGGENTRRRANFKRGNKIKANETEKQEI
jgi:hypothetical protein